MSYELQVPFENLTLANGNARTKKTAYLKYSSISSGSSTRWGSNWVYVDEDGDGVTEARSTLYDVGKIGIKLNNLGLPSILPSGTEIHIQVTSTAKWCGAGYIQGHVSFKDLTLNETVKWNSEGRQMVQQSDLKNSRIAYCKSSYGWTTDSSEYHKGPSPEWIGTFSESLELGSNETLYIYMLDTVYNFGNPGSTNFKFNKSTFKVWFILPYTQVGEPSEFAIKIDSAEGNVAYDTKIDLSWTAAEDGANNPVNNYKLWCKPADAEPFIFGSIGNLETTYSYIGYKALPSMVKRMNYQVGIQAIATHENLNSEIVYSPEIISVVNTAPPAPTVSTFSRLRINTDENSGSISTSVAFDECYSEDPDFFYAPENYRNETLKYFYYLSATKNLFKESPEITPKEDEINIVDENGNNCKFLELPVDSQWKATVEMNKDKPWFHVIAQDGDGVYSPITSYCVEKNFAAKEPRITLSAATTIVSFDKTKTYTDNIEHITFGLGEDERSFKSVFYLINENSKEIELGEVSEETFVYSGGAAYLYTGSKDFSQAGYGNEIKIKVKYTDQYGDTFEVISSEYDENNNLQTNQIYYYPKLMSEIAKNFSMDIWANGWTEEVGILKTYLKSELNNCQLGLILSDDDIPTYVNIYRQSSEDSRYGLLISDTFQAAGSNEKNFTLTNVFKYTDSSNNPVKYKFYYKLSNGFDQSTNYKQYLTNTYQVLPKFNVSEGDFSFSQNNWHPLKIYVDNVIIREGNDELVEFTCPYNNTEGIGNNRYKFEANCNGNTYILAEELTGAGNSLWSASISGSTIEFMANNMEVFKQFGINLNSPTLNVTYKLTGYNAYGAEGDYKTYENCTITTQEAPFFDAMSLVPVIESDATDSYRAWFNPNDKITFSRLQGGTLTYPFDYNDYDFNKDGKIEQVNQTISNYKIYFKYYDDENWKEVSQGVFIYDKDCISFSAPDLAQNNTKTSVIFGVSLLDNAGLETEIEKVSGLWACRLTNPSLKISGADIVAEEDNQYLSVNLISSDLGGNDTDKENFTRSGAETFSITIYAATTIDDLISGRNASVLLSSGVYSESPNNTNLNKNLTARFLLGNNDTKLKEAEKLYIKVAITITTNSVTRQVINSITTTFLLYLNSPTMAHRAHWIGLNTAEKENDEVFKIKAFKDKKIIRLVGPYLADKTLLISNADERLLDSDNNLLIGYSGNQEEAQEDMVIEIDLTKGTIYSPDYCLNLKTGEFIGNTLVANSLKIPEWGGKYTGNIDGGTW